MKNYVFALFVFVNIYGFSQSKIVGVVQSETNDLLEGAKVTLHKTGKIWEVKTDRLGTFEFSVSNGSYQLLIERAGFQSHNETIEVDREMVVERKITIYLDVFQFEEIAIVSESMGLTDRTPYNIHTLDAKGITMKGSPSGMMGLIQREPGVNAAEMGHGIVKPFIRGLGFSRVATIYQGGKLENHQWGADHGLGLNDLGIGSIDIIKGPASLLYGSGALGGVLVMNDDQHYLYRSEWSGNIGTTLNTVSSGVRTYGSIGKRWDNGYYFAVDAAYENHADYYDGNNRLIGNSRFNTSTIRLHTGYQSGDYKARLAYSFNQQFLGIIEDDEMEEGESLATFRGDRSMQLPFQDVTDHIVSLLQQYRINDQWTAQADVVFHHNDRKEIEDDFDEIDLGLLQNHLFYNIRFLHKPNGKFSGTYGWQGAFLDMSNHIEAEEILIPNATYFENAIYTVGTFKPNKMNTIQAGFRFDYRPMLANANQENIIEEGYVLPGDPADRKLNLTFFGLTGSLGYTFQPNQQNMWKLNFSSGFRSPDVAELLSNGPHPGTNRFEVGNVNFRREQSAQGDLTWLRNTKFTTVAISSFGNFVDNYIYFLDSGDTTNTGLNIWEFQQTNAFLYGGEVEFTFKPLGNERLAIHLLGNVVRGLDITNSGFLTFVPADRAGLDIRFQPFKDSPFNIEMGYERVFLQSRPGTGEQQTEGYNLLRSTLSYAFIMDKRKLELGISGFNLLNESYIDHISILRAFDVTSPGINVMLNLRYTF
ncbi:MAG: TonB-dependent receptor [Crocinitomicaceae bacterium]|nr:TonB-dependent receptor [Crocinitomicaceae bacterium]